jgi:hypothetical protein
MDVTKRMGLPVFDLHPLVGASFGGQGLIGWVRKLALSGKCSS